MKRKTKAFWIGFLAPMVMLWAWTAVFAWGWMGSGPGLCEFFLWTGPAIVAGGLVGLIAYLCTSGPPMSRRGKAAWIGFFVPVVPASGILLYFYLGCTHSSPMQGMFTQVAVMFVEWPSILLGLLIAAIAFARTENKDRDPLKCVGCGYSLVGLESGECPECGKKTP